MNKTYAEMDMMVILLLGLLSRFHPTKQVYKSSANLTVIRIDEAIPAM
jgi:hypothetical protein